MRKKVCFLAALAALAMSPAVTEAQDNCSTFDWQLDDAQMARLNEAVETYIDFDGSAPLK